MHQRRIIETVARCGSASRSSLARAAGMSQPTVSRIVDQLLADQILAESANEVTPMGNDSSKVSTVLGRPSIQLQLDWKKPRFGIVQLGVRHTRLAILPAAIPSEDQWESEFDTPASAGAWLRQLTKWWKPYRSSGLKTVVSLPGVVDERTGKVYLSPNIPWLKNADLDTTLRTIFGPELVFKQEIRLMALGQMAVEPESGDFLLVDSGNGVGAAAVIGSGLFNGSLPLSGEIGHVAVAGNRRSCGCGAVGCLETLISRAGFLASAAENGQRGSWPELIEHLGDHPLPHWLKHSLESAAVGIAAALNLLGLRQVVLTGAFRELPENCVRHLGDAISHHAMWARFDKLSIRTAPRRRQAGVVSVALDSLLFT
jgi:predicted NBD/HSP70 family sugar kinase